MKTKQTEKLKLVEIILLLVLAAFLTSGALALQTGQELSDKVVRLHVLANSDSEEDQALKLKVRDRLLAYTEPILAGSADRREAEALLRLLSMGIGVKLVERDAVRCEELCELLPKAMIIHGEGIDRDLLMEEGLENCESFVALTGNDEENLFLSMFAGTKTKGKLVTKINRLSYDEIIERLDLGSIVCPKQLTAQYILQYVRAKQNSIGSNVENIYRILENKADALEFNISAKCPLLNIPLEKMRLRSNLIVAAIIRGRQIIMPRGQDEFRVGDSVIVVTSGNQIFDITDIQK